MKHRLVEIVHLVNGEPVSVRRLSRRREIAAMAAAVSGVCGVYLAVMLADAMVARGLHSVLYTPVFVAIWLAAAALVSVLAARRARRRAQRYVVGAMLDADAFAPVEVDLVRRVPGGRFELTIVPGMRGYVHDSGRAPMPVEALVHDRAVAVPLEEAVRAELTLGTSTFAVRGMAGAPAPAVVRGEGSRRSFDRTAVAGLTATVGLGAVLVGWMVPGATAPVGVRIGESSLVPTVAMATPWEAEKRLRTEAQLQALSLHQCFDPLPLECQQAGYVGIGLSLQRSGEIRKEWIASSTYHEKACAVDACMADVVSSWTFGPLPEPMRVVLPVQVVLTAKPRPGTAKVDVSVSGKVPAPGRLHMVAWDVPSYVTEE